MKLSVLFMIVGLALAAPASASATCFLGFGDCGGEGNGNGNGPQSTEVTTIVNSHNSVRTSNSLHQGQGQEQGQFQKQGQGQSQVGVNEAVGSGNETTVTTVYEAQKRNPVSSAAPVFATSCSRGVSGQLVGGAGALASTNEICDLATAAELAANIGNFELRDKLVERAGELALARANRLRVWFQWVPFVGQLY